jgi:hypothetical protein
MQMKKGFQTISSETLYYLALPSGLEPETPLINSHEIDEFK